MFQIFFIELITLMYLLRCDFDRISQQAMKAKFHSVKSKHIAKANEAQVKLLKQDAENQHAIISKKQSSDFVSANSMSPHLSMHSTRGQEAGRGRHIKVQPVSSCSVMDCTSERKLTRLHDRLRMASKPCPQTKLHLFSKPMSSVMHFQPSP